MIGILSRKLKGMDKKMITRELRVGDCLAKWRFNLK